MKSLTATLSIAFISVLPACGTPSNQPAGGGGSGQGGATGTGGSGVAGGTGGAGGAPASTSTAPPCNQVAEDAPTYSITWAAGTAPTPKGGTIMDGTYVLTRQTGYTATTLPATEVGRDKVEINGSAWQEDSGILPYGVNPDKHSTSTLSTQGMNLTLTRTCPSAGAPTTTAFTADASSLTLFVVDQGMTFETVFTRQ